MAATLTDIRRLALIALFQLDATKGGEPEAIKAGLSDAALLDEDHAIFDEETEPFTDNEVNKAFDLASGAWDHRAAADKETAELAPEWPPSRQAAVDRAILRLAHYEMTSGRVSPKIAVNEAVELAKAFSTEKSPAFINGVLGKVLKRVLAGDAGDTEATEADEGGEG